VDDPATLAAWRVIIKTVAELVAKPIKLMRGKRTTRKKIKRTGANSAIAPLPVGRRILLVLHVATR
jgi:hypothetical protein